MNWLLVLIILIVGCDLFGNFPCMDVLLLPLCVYGYLRYNIKGKPAVFGKRIMIIMFCVMVSTISCNYFRGQSYFDSFMALRFFWLFMLYYLVFYIQPPAANIIKGLKCFYFIYVFLYLLKVLFPNIPIGLSFDSYASITSSDSFTSVFILGLYITVFGFSYYLNQFFISGRKHNLLLMSGALFVWFYSLSRTNLVACIIVVLYSFCHYTKYKRVKFKTMIGILLAVFLIYNTPIVQQASQKIITKQTEGSNLDNDSYIRVIQFDYFVNEHFKSPVEFLLGSGMPHGNSAYGQMMLSHGETGGIKTGWFDWGMIGLSWVLGITTVLSLLFLYWKAFRKFVSNQLFFVNLIYLFFIVSAPFAILSFDSGGFVMQSFLLYLISISTNDFNNNSFVQQRKNNKRNNSFSM